MSFPMNRTGRGGVYHHPNLVPPAPAGVPVETPEQELQVVHQCEVTVHDVLLGRGRGPNMHPGNQRYREMIYANRDNYNRASNRTEQTRITRDIVNHVKKRGRFLKRLESRKGKKKKKRGDMTGDVWVMVVDATARLKVGQCLRYKLRQDAEQQDDGSCEGDNFPEGFGVLAPQKQTKKAVGAIIPNTEVSGVATAEKPMAEQPHQKYRKVEVPDEPVLNKEEMQVLKAFGRAGAVVEEDAPDDDSFGGFLDSPMWEAKPSSSMIITDDDLSEQRSSATGGYYDTMMDSNGGSYDSNFAYGNDLMSDAEIFSALGYPQPPLAPSSRPPILCYCGCRVNPADASNHRCSQRHGIFMPRSVANLNVKTQQDTPMGQPEDNTFCVVGNKNNMYPPPQDVTMNQAESNVRSVVGTSTAMFQTPMVTNMAPQMPNINSWAPGQTAGPGMTIPFQVPDEAPGAKSSTIFRSYAPSQNATVRATSFTTGYG